MLSKPYRISTDNVEFAPVRTTQENCYTTQFDESLRKARYEYNLLNSESTTSLQLIDLPFEELKNYRFDRSFSNRKHNRLRSYNLSSLTNINFSPSHYLDNFWKGETAPNEHVTFLGYDEDLGPICASITTHDNSHIVHLRTYWKSSKITVADDIELPDSLKNTHVLTPKANSLILYLALEKYLDEIEEDWFRLLDWQQKIQFTAPYHRDGVTRFNTDHRNYVSELKREITFAISAPQLAKQDLPRVVGQLEKVEDLSIRRPLLNIEGHINQKYVFTDIVTHLSGLNRTMEQRDTYNRFLNICGQMLVSDGVVVEREELKRPEILTEDLGNIEQVQYRRNTVFDELLETELKYIKKIKAIDHVFVKPFRELANNRKKAIVLPYDIKSLFNNIEEIIEANNDFLEELMMFDKTKDNLGNLCEKHISKFDIYQSYIAGYKHSLEYHCALERKNDAYYNFVMDARDHPECDKLALKDLLVMPVQRLPRYKLLFTDYLRFTPKTHPEYKGLYNALIKVNEISNLGSQRLQENAQQLSFILRCINDCPPVLLSSSRYLVTQIDCVECDISTLTPQDNITIFLLSDGIIITKRAKDHGSNKRQGYDFISWISLNGIDILDPGLNGNLHGIMIRGALDFSEDLYWDHQELHLFTTSNLSDKERFYSELTKATAICRAVASGSTCFHQTVNDIGMFFFIYDPETYTSSSFKNEIALHYVENSSTAPDEYFKMMYPSLIHGMIQGIDCRFTLHLRSKVPYYNLEEVINPEELKKLTPEDPRYIDKMFQLPYMFRDFFFHQLIYHTAALRATPAYLHMQHLINRCMLESLFGLHFPDCRSAHPYLHRLKSISRTYKDDRPVLVSNGSANASIQPRKSPYRQHRLGTLSTDNYRDISKNRSITAPEPSTPPFSSVLFPFTSSKNRNSISSDPSAMTRDKKHDTVGERKKRGSFIKVSRFFSWGK